MRLHGIARATLLCVGVWLLPAAAHATTIGPDAFGYTATNEVPFSFVNIQPTGTRVLADVDDATVAAAIGFDFNFYGTTFNNLFISSNGILTVRRRQQPIRERGYRDKLSLCQRSHNRASLGRLGDLEPR